MRNAIAAVLAVLLCTAVLAQPLAPAQPPAPPAGTQPSAPAQQPGPPAQQAAPPTEAPQPEKVLLELKFAAGQVLRYRGFADMAGAVNVAMTGAPQQPQQPQQPFNMQVPVSAKGVVAMTARVIKQDAYGGTRLRVSMDSASVNVDVMGHKIQMALNNGKLTTLADGQKTTPQKLPNLPGGQAIPFVQKPMEVKIGKRGQIMDIVVPGFEKEWKQMMEQVKKMSGGMDPMTIMRQGQILLPDHPIGVGEGWNHHLEVPLAGGAPMVMDMNFTLDSLETVNGKQIATLGVTGRETMTNIDLGTMMKQGMAQGGAQMPQIPPISGRMNGEFGISGKARFDVTAGTVDRYDFRVDINFSMNGTMPSPSGQQPMTMTMNMAGQMNGALARLQ